METVYLPNGATFNYRRKRKDLAIQYIAIERPDKVEGLSSYWFDADFNLICTLIGISYADFLKMTVMKFIECLEE